MKKPLVEGNKFERPIAEEKEVSLDKPGRVIQVLIHALRNRLVNEESFQLLVQLPVTVIGLYVVGWRFDNEFHRISHINDFPDEVQQEDVG